MRTCYLLRGLPASGKSTWARKKAIDTHSTALRVNRDDLQAMLGLTEYTRENDALLRELQHMIVKHLLTHDHDAIVDSTNLNQRTVQSVYELCAQIGDVTLEEVVFDVPVGECIKRNALREKITQVPDNVIRSMASRMPTLRNVKKYFPRRTRTCVQDKTLPRAILCDIDGTLALINGRDPYDTAKCASDLPNMPIVNLVKAMRRSGYKVIFMTGRDEKYNNETRKFIESTFQVKTYIDAVLPEEREVKTETLTDYDLHMRQNNDRRRDTIVKRELFERHVQGNYFVEFVIDDRSRVVDMWRNDLGLCTLQPSD